MLAFFLSPLGRLIGVGALAALLAGAGTWWVTSDHYTARIASIEEADAKADAKRANDTLAKFVQNADRISAAASAYAAGQSTSGKQFDAIMKDLRNVQARKPLPPSCKPDTDRLRNLSAAVAAANAQAGR